MNLIFENGKRKVLTLSYDDGHVDDKKLIEILDKYGLKATFNINTGMYNEEEKDGSRMTRQQAIDLYKNSHAEICKEIGGARYTDEDITETIKACYKNTGYLLDPHGACGYQALYDLLQNGEQGVFLETAHPAKFLSTVENIIGEKVEIPAKLQEFMKGTKQSVEISKEFDDFKDYLLNTLK